MAAGPDRARHVTGGRLVAVAAVAFVGPFVAGSLFHVAFGFIDRAAPRAGPASAALVAVVVVWLAALVLLRWSYGPRGWPPLLGGGVAGAAAAVPLVLTVQGSYASAGALRPPYPGVVVASVVVSGLVGLGVLLCLWRMSGERPLGGLAALASGLTATYGFAGLWLLVTIAQQVAQSGGLVWPGP